MEEKIKEDLLNIITQALKFIEAKDTDGLKEVSNFTIHNASIFQDKDSVTIAILIYAISKVAERSGGIGAETADSLAEAKKALEADNITLYEEVLKRLVESISSIDRKMNYYIQHIIDEAGIKKGSKLYAHGISVAQTAEIFGITQWELMKYLGQTNIAEEFADEVEIKERIGVARKLFGTSG